MNIPEGLTQGLRIIAGLACAGTLAGFLSRWGWLCELASHFRAQYAWTLFFCGALLFLAHRPLEAGVAATCGLVNVPLIVSQLAAANRSPAVSGRSCRFLLLNVQVSSRASERLRRFLRETDPDVLILQEVDEAWMAALQEVRRAFPYARAVPRPSGSGMALLSRLPCDQEQIVQLGGVEDPVILVRLRLDGQALTVIAIHPLSPTNPWRAAARNRQLVEVAALARRQPGAVVVIGDLNTTPWSFAFHDLMRSTRLRDSRNGFGRQPSWPVPVWPLLIPIDHCLVSPEVVVHQRYLGPNVGSDHYPLIVDLSIGENFREEGQTRGLIPEAEGS